MKRSSPLLVDRLGAVYHASDTLAREFVSTLIEWSSIPCGNAVFTVVVDQIVYQNELA